MARRLEQSKELFFNILRKNAGAIQDLFGNWAILISVYILSSAISIFITSRPSAPQRRPGVFSAFLLVHVGFEIKIYVGLRFDITINCVWVYKLYYGRGIKVNDRYHENFQFRIVLSPFTEGLREYFLT